MLRLCSLLILPALLFCGCGYEVYTEPLPMSSSSVVTSSSSSSIIISSSSSSVIVSSSSSSVVAYSSSTGESSSSLGLETFFLDNRDGRTYKYVTIGTQTWMAENLRYDTPNFECYNYDPVNCEIYGKLYNWETAIDICPSDWHLPSDAEWNKLRDFVGSNVVGTKLKADSDLWISGRGTDNFGFAALPGGIHSHYGSPFGEIGEVAAFWSATPGSQAGSAHARYFNYYNTTLNLVGLYLNTALVYVRCVKD